LFLRNSADRNLNQPSSFHEAINLTYSLFATLLYRKVMFLQDEDWLKVAPLLLSNTYGGGGSAKDNRLFIEAILWRVNNQKRWSDLPVEYGSWNTCYVRFRRWNDSGIWKDLASSLADWPDLRAEFQKIVTYGALYDAQAIARLRRKENRKNREHRFFASMNVSGNVDGQ
jgi:transposase